MIYRYSITTRRVALRAMERAHARWMSTPKWSPDHFWIKDRKEHAMAVYDRSHRPSAIVSA